MCCASLLETVTEKNQPANSKITVERLLVCFCPTTLLNSPRVPATSACLPNVHIRSGWLRSHKPTLCCLGRTAGLTAFVNVCEGRRPDNAMNRTARRMKFYQRKTEEKGTGPGRLRVDQVLF